MTTRLDDATTTTDPVVRGIVIVTMAITIVGVLALIRAAVGGSGVDHVTVRIDNQAGLAVQVDALDAGRHLRGPAGPPANPGQDGTGCRQLDGHDPRRRDQCT